MVDTQTIRYYLTGRLTHNLFAYCPVLSGNMRAHITMNIFKRQTRIVIRAPFYDINYWRKTGKIRYIHKNLPYGMKHYAYLVNKSGAFGKHNASQHWVNRTINESCYLTAVKFKVEMEGFLPR